MTLKSKRDLDDPHVKEALLVATHSDEEVEPTHDESNWLVSYADMMTLLCGFFIMLFSMAKMDEPKYETFKAELSKQFGGEYVSPTKELARFATEIIQESGVDDKIMIQSEFNGVAIVIESTVFFQSLSADVSKQGKKILTDVIKKVFDREKLTGKNYKIVVEGHTDSKPIIGGDYPSNWELSGARAARVVRLFLENGFAANQMAAIGYADTQPQIEPRKPDGEFDETALSKNRRVVIRILEPSVEAIPFPQTISQKSAAVSVPPSATPVSVGTTAAPQSAPAVFGPMPLNTPTGDVAHSNSRTRANVSVGAGTGPSVTKITSPATAAPKEIPVLTTTIDITNPTEVKIESK